MTIADLLGSSMQTILGRKNLFRLARKLSYQARRDTLNDFSSNGEAEVQDIVLASLHPQVVFDVGSNIGEWSAELLRRADTANLAVHAFEPCQSTYQQLTTNIADPRLVPVRMACSAASGNAMLHIVEPGCGRNSLVDGLAGGVIAERVILTTVDDYCDQNGISKIDFLKVDAEGHDLEVLLGSQRMLSAHRISALQFEYNHRWILARRFLRDAMELFANAKYDFGKITPHGIEFYSAWDLRLETFVEGNYLACLPEVTPNFDALSPDWLD